MGILVFTDAVSDERMTLGPIDEEGIREMKERYEALEPSDKKIVEEEEDKLLSTMIYNFTAYMVMMEVILWRQHAKDKSTNALLVSKINNIYAQFEIQIKN